jgi:sporulation protein YhbH
MPITEGNWDLHKGGSKDASRHREKLKDAFKKKLHDIISQEDIITSEKGKKVKVPIKALDSYRFIFDPKKRKHVGQGTGEEEEGDVLSQDGDQEAKGDKAGDGAGEEFYEAEIDIADLVDMMLEDLKLPRLDPKKHADMKTNDVRYDEVRKKGQMSNLDKKRSLIQNIKRNAQTGDATIHHISDDDLRFRTWREYDRPVTSAVVIAMMDVSGSMGQDKKYLARSFFFWMVNFLRAKYQEVQVEFVSHTAEARVCTEHEFFYSMESGGTMCSSAYELAKDLIATKYDPNMYNIFAFHFSDGDTFGDDEECVNLLTDLTKVCNMVGYGEINTHAQQQQGMFGAYFQHSTLHDFYANNIKADNFVMNMIHSKDDVWPTLQKFFSGELDA